MLGNFVYSNPTKLYFGEDSLQYLSEELPKYGKNVQLIYGSGSIKKNGIYGQVMELLKANGKVVVEDGMTLSAVSLPYYRHIMPYGLAKFCRFAVNVWGVDANEKTGEQIAEEGLSCMENWMKELGLVMNLRELGATEEMLDGIADGTAIMEGGYKLLNRDEILDILKASL